MLRNRPTATILGVSAALCLLMTIVGESSAKEYAHPRHSTHDRLVSEHVLDVDYSPDFHDAHRRAITYGFHQAKWRRWPSFAPHDAEVPSEDQRNPLPPYAPPEAAREEKTLPPSRNSIRDRSNSPLRKPAGEKSLPGQLIPNPIDTKGPSAEDESPGNPFKDDKIQGDDRGLELDRRRRGDGLLPEVDLPADDTTSGRLPRRIMTRVTQTTAIPSVRSIEKATTQSAALPVAEPFDDSAPRPNHIKPNRTEPQLLPALGNPAAATVKHDLTRTDRSAGRSAVERPERIAPQNIVVRSDIASQPALALPKIRRPQLVAPISDHSDFSRKPAAGPYNPLRSQHTDHTTAAATTTSVVRPTSHHQTTPRRRNPLR